MNYLYVKIANLDKLTNEIRVANLPLDHLSVASQNQLTVVTSRSLTEPEIESLDSIVDAHSPLDVETNVRQIIFNAINFGQSLILKAATENVMMGITQSGKTGAVMDYTHELVHALLTGSLVQAIHIIDGYIADNSAAKINVSPFITNERLTATKNQIQDYLGIPRT